MAKDTLPTAPPAPPSPDGAAVAADTADLLRRYLSGESLTPKENGLVGAHYKRVGQPVPKEKRAESLAAKRIGPALAARALVDDMPAMPGESAGPTMAPGQAQADTAAFADLLRTGLGTLESWLVAKTERVARKLGGDERTVAGLKEDAKFSPKAVDLIVNPLPRLAAKYGVSTEYVDEASVFAGLASVGLQAGGLLQKLAELEKKADERERQRQQPAQAPAPASA